MPQDDVTWKDVIEGPMKTLNRRMALIAVVVAILAAAVASTARVSTALAAGGPLFATSAQPAVPAGGATGASESATLNSISCGSPGNCVAGGSYDNPAGGQQAMVEAETGGTWAAPQRIGLPAGAVTLAADEYATITSVSCPSQGFCVAVGAYRGTGNGMLVATETAGVWATGTTLAAVSGEAADGGVLDSVSCTSIENCVAVGTVTTNRGLIEPAIAAVANGTWGKPSLPTLPSGDQDTLPTSLSVSCPAAGACVVAGTDYPASGPELPLVIAQSGGRWQQPETVGPLSGAVADPGQLLSLGTIDCSAVGSCTAIGNDETAAGASGFALVDAGGSFTEVELAYPTGTAGFLANVQDVGLDAVGCADPGDCVAGGAYPTAGTPTLPDAAPMAAIEGGGTWSAPTALPAPSDAAPAASGLATVRSISCPVAADCQGVGVYETAGGQRVPMLAVPVPVLTLANTPLPAAQLGRPYSAQIVASGGAGAATWSVSSGTLPIGLTLNSASGVISGTPRFTERTAFTVTVTDLGPPAQAASVSLAIAVTTTAPAPPVPLLSGLKVSPRHASVAGRRVGHRCEAVTRLNRHRRPCRRTVRLSMRARLSLAATVRLTATRMLPGRVVRHGHAVRCQAPTRRDRHGRRCTRTARVRGTDTFTLRAGTRTVRFDAAVGGHALTPGTYRLQLVPSAGGETGRPATATITITG
jgi:hypothetical protein